MIDSFSEEFLLDYTYSKNSHINLFKEKGYDLELYGRNLNVQDDIDLITYQNLMIYSFLIDKKGLKILQIENSELISFAKLQDRHECWKIDIENIKKPFGEIQYTPIHAAKEMNIENPASYFDFIFLPLTYNTISKDIQCFEVILSNIKLMLKANGILLSSFMNILINGQIWPDEIFDFLSKDKRIINKMERFSKIDFDKDLFALPENFYNKYWKEYTKKTYIEFGKAYCYNLFLDNKGKIYPENFSDFSYLKKSHKDFFITNGYADELFDNGNEVFDTTGYKSLLVYSFIKSNLNKGDKILQIGNAPVYLEKAIKKDYDYFILESIEELSDSMKFNEKEQLVIKNENRININCKNFFNFSFSINTFDNIEYNPYKYRIIINNIDKLMQIGGFTLFSFNFIKTGKKLRHSIFLAFLFCNNVFRLHKYIKQDIVLSDDDLLINKINSSDNIMFENEESKSENISIYSILWKKILYLSATGIKNTETGLKKYPSYVFHHLMKCGGTSLFSILDKWFKTIDDNILLEDINTYIMKKYNVSNFHNDICLRAHFQRPGIFLHERYPELLNNKNEFRIFTFIRDPLAVSVSRYYFLKSLNVFNDNISLKEDLLRGKNFIASLIPCDERNFKEMIDRYYFVGIVERLQESFDIFAELIGKKIETIPYLNKSEKDKQLEALGPDFIEEFKKKNKLDYDIYNYCLEKFIKFSKV